MVRVQQVPPDVHLHSTTEVQFPSKELSAGSSPAGGARAERWLSRSRLPIANREAPNKRSRVRIPPSSPFALVVESADTADLKFAVRKGVRVRVPPRVPLLEIPTAISLLGAKCYWFKSNQAHACSSTGGAFVSTMESRFSFIKAHPAILAPYQPTISNVPCFLGA